MVHPSLIAILCAAKALSLTWQRDRLAWVFVIAAAGVLVVGFVL